MSCCAAVSCAPSAAAFLVSHLLRSCPAARRDRGGRGFAVIAYVFTVAPFSFGYLLGFNFYVTVLGYLWLNHFSDLNYDHRLGALSAAASAIAFLVLHCSSHPRSGKDGDYAPGVRPDSRLYHGIRRSHDCVGSLYGFRVISLEDIYDFREGLKFRCCSATGLESPRTHCYPSHSAAL